MITSNNWTNCLSGLFNSDGDNNNNNNNSNSSINNSNKGSSRNQRVIVHLAEQLSKHTGERKKFKRY